MRPLEEVRASLKRLIWFDSLCHYDVSPTELLVSFCPRLFRLRGISGYVSFGLAKVISNTFIMKICHTEQQIPDLFLMASYKHKFVFQLSDVSLGCEPGQADELPSKQTVKRPTIGASKRSSGAKVRNSVWFEQKNKLLFNYILVSSRCLNCLAFRSIVRCSGKITKQITK